MHVFAQHRGGNGGCIVRLDGDLRLGIYCSWQYEKGRSLVDQTSFNVVYGGMRIETYILERNSFISEQLGRPSPLSLIKLYSRSLCGVGTV